jgi:hypothetical protein
MKKRLAEMWKPPHGLLIRIEMHKASGVGQAKFAVRIGWAYKMTHNPPRKEPKPIAKIPGSLCGLRGCYCLLKLERLE